MKRVLFSPILWSLLISVNVMAQSSSPNTVVQFSGRVLTEQRNGSLSELIYASVAVKNTTRGTSTDIEGFFSLPVRKGETILIRNIGYLPKEITIPTDIEGNLYSKDIILKRDTIFLPETMIYPWPDRDYFEIEFLALQVNNRLEEILAKNLAPEKMQRLVTTLPVDGTEISRIELENYYNSFKYEGQFQPMNIFNPISWAQFINAIKRGDFKKKK